MLISNRWFIDTGCIWSLMICMAWFHIAGGTVIFCNTHGVWGTVGIFTGGKYFSSKQPLLSGTQEKAFLWSWTIQWRSFTSSGQSHFMGLRSKVSAHSYVKCSPGIKSGGCVGKGLRPASGLSGKTQVTWKDLSVDPMTAQTFFATGL